VPEGGDDEAAEPWGLGLEGGAEALVGLVEVGKPAS
jgi:hypothetical protein